MPNNTRQDHHRPAGCRTCCACFFSRYVKPFLTMTVTPIILMLLVYANKNLTKGQLSEFPALVHVAGSFPRLAAMIAIKFIPTWFALTIVVEFIIFQFILAKIIPGKAIKGPPSPTTGFMPTYPGNGVYCYLVSMATLGLIIFVSKNYFNSTPTILINRFDEMIGACNAVSIFCCCFLYAKAFTFPTSLDDCRFSGNFLFDFFWGTENHPCLFGLDVKWFINGRIGMTIWPLVVVLCWLRSYEAFGWQWGTAVSSILQICYATKFFLFESSVFLNSVDMKYDNAGYYICWGNLTFQTALYTFTSQYLAFHRATVFPLPAALLLLFVGLFFLVSQRLADADKEVVRVSNGERSILGWRPKVIRACYLNFDDSQAESILLVSGFWGFSRHYSYFAEFVVALCWCMAGGFESSFPYFYFIFILFLLVHRSYEHDARCAKKYGSQWDEYVRQVPYRILPYVF